MATRKWTIPEHHGGFGSDFSMAVNLCCNTTGAIAVV